MLSSILEGELTFTRQRIQKILRTESCVKQPGDVWFPPELDIYSFEFERRNGVIKHNNAAERQMRARNWCTELKAQVKNPNSHLEVLDGWYSKLLKCHFQPVDVEETILEGVCNMLARLPEIPPELHDPLVDSSY